MIDFDLWRRIARNDGLRPCRTLDEVQTLRGAGWASPSMVRSILIGLRDFPELELGMMSTDDGIYVGSNFVQLEIAGVMYRLDASTPNWAAISGAAPEFRPDRNYRVTVPYRRTGKYGTFGLDLVAGNPHDSEDVVHVAWIEDGEFPPAQDNGDHWARPEDWQFLADQLAATNGFRILWEDGAEFPEDAVVDAPVKAVAR